jgi:hypothetical protein
VRKAAIEHVLYLDLSSRRLMHAGRRRSDRSICYIRPPPRHRPPEGRKGKTNSRENPRSTINVSRCPEPGRRFSLPPSGTVGVIDRLVQYRPAASPGSGSVRFAKGQINASARRKDRSDNPIRGFCQGNSGVCEPRPALPPIIVAENGYGVSFVNKFREQSAFIVERRHAK